MHELSIALNIVEIACEESQRRGNARISAVYLKLGALSGVVKDALLFSWELACDGTPLAGARLDIEEIPIAVWCPQCAAQREIAGPFEMLCPECGMVVTEVRQGRELEVRALEIEDG
jgi:hydrogenase nickel incorporation protein HypA/HybF